MNEIVMDWRAKSACQGLDPVIFYPESEHDCELAKSVCAKCSVSVACLNYALDNRELQGVWGGVSAGERKRLLRVRRSA